jgi:hypothetical protein
MSGEKENKFYEDEDKKFPANHHVSRSNPKNVHEKRDARLFCEEEQEESKCPPQHIPRSNPNKVTAGHKPAKGHKQEPKHHEQRHMKQPPKESSDDHKAHRYFTQKDDEEDVTVEEGVLLVEKDQIKGAAHGGHVVSWSNPNDWRVTSDEARHVARGTPGGRHVVSALIGPDGSPGAEVVDSQANPPNVTSQRRSHAALAPIRPGAERVDGFGNRGLDDDTFTITIGEEEEVTIEPSPPTLSAQLVNTKEEENRAVQKFLQNAVVADIVPDVDPENSGRRWKVAILFLLLMLIVVGVVLAFRLRPDPDPTLSPEALSDLLSSVSSDKGEALLTNSTPQNKAFNWMVANNTRLGTLSKEQIIQRYALATLYYSANGASWNINEVWLEDVNECGIWQTTNGQLGCTGTNAVSNLELGLNNLNGTIPPEIGLLTSLGEFVLVINCHNALAWSFWVSIRVHLVILMVCLDCLCRLSKSFGQ